MGIVYTGKNVNDLDGVRFSDINGDVSYNPSTFVLPAFLSVMSGIIHGSLLYRRANVGKQGRSDLLWLNDQGATVSSFPLRFQARCRLQP